MYIIGSREKSSSVAFTDFHNAELGRAVHVEFCSQLQPTTLLTYPFSHRASLVAQLVKNLPVKQEMWVRSLGKEDPLEKEMATHSSILAWEIPWTEEPGGL